MTKVAIKFGFAAIVCAVGLLPPTMTSANSQALTLLQQGYAECKSAHLLRRKDLEAAKAAFKQYQDLKAQSAAMDNQLYDTPNAEVERITSYCDTVGGDIARTEALPLFQQGVAACAEAAEHLRNSDLDNARSAYSRYLDHKDEAVAISTAILDVFSVRTEMRRCERLAEDMADAEAHQAQLAEQLSVRINGLEDVLQQCRALPKPTNMDAAALTELQNSLVQLFADDEQAPDELLRQEDVVIPEAPGVRIAELKERVDACRSEIQQAVTTRQQALVKLAEEEKRRQEELAKQQAERQAEEQAERPETLEERRVRLTKNSQYFTLVKQVPPEFPRHAQRRGMEGFVVVEYMINAAGDVLDAVVVESEPSGVFDKAAVAAVSQWRYQADFGQDEPDSAIGRTRIQFRQ